MLLWRTVHERASLPILTLRLTERGLYDRWDHCQGLAGYAARFAASDRFDPEQLTTRLASSLNEVLEYVFRARPGGEGEVALHIVRNDTQTVVEVALPTDPALAERLRSEFERLALPDARERYAAGFQAMLAGAPAEAGLLELVALHGVTLSLRDDAGAATILLSLPHE